MYSPDYLFSRPLRQQLFCSGVCWAFESGGGASAGRQPTEDDPEDDPDDLSLPNDMLQMLTQHGAADPTAFWIYVRRLVALGSKVKFSDDILCAGMMSQDARSAIRAYAHSKDGEAFVRSAIEWARAGEVGLTL